MKDYTKQDIINLVEEQDVEFIRLQFTDILGNLKNIAITSSQLEKALNNKYMFDASAIDGLIKVEDGDSDLYLYPDYNTLEIFPWRPQQGKVARLICDIYRSNGQPFEGDARSVLKKSIAKAKEMGYTFEVGPECEFFLFHTDENGQPTTLTHEQAGYFDLGPIDLGENARRDMVLTLEEMGFDIESSHHEVAPAQHEIDFKYDEALKTADNIMTFKLTVKTIAKRHGLHATFMPKPKCDANGSGMHINMSLSKDGKNVFSDEKDKLGLSKEAYYFIGGIMKYLKGMTAITNPLINSYKRLVPCSKAPVYCAWSVNNNSSIIRIPSERGEGTRIELRNPDPAANPYLTLAICLEAGLEGIKNKIMPPEKVDEKLFRLSKKELKEKNIDMLPSTLKDAVNELEKDEFIKSILGDYISEIYIEEKNKEWEKYNTQVTDWEIGQYLYKI